jgi:hypothetical protein
MDYPFRTSTSPRPQGLYYSIKKPWIPAFLSGLFIYKKKYHPDPSFLKQHGAPNFPLQPMILNELPPYYGPSPIF